MAAIRWLRWLPGLFAKPSASRHHYHAQRHLAVSTLNGERVATNRTVALCPMYKPAAEVDAATGGGLDIQFDSRQIALLDRRTVAPRPGRGLTLLLIRNRALVFEFMRKSLFSNTAGAPA